jgi:hypothetical protein
VTKYRPYPRRAYRRLFRSWAKRNVNLIAMSAAVMLAIVVAESAVLLWLFPNGRFTWWVLGVVQATVVGICLHLLNAAFLAHDAEAIWQLRGAWGEEATREQLLTAKRKRLIWGWVDSINLQSGDIDHLVITRQGGLVAIDSKWRSQAHDTADMARDARKVKLRAEALAGSLLKAERSAHRARGTAITVTPLVVVWGATQHDVPEQACIADIDFVGGRRLVKWLAQLTGDPVDKTAATDVLRRLETFRATAWSESR